MDATQRAPPRPWESTSGDAVAGPEADPAKVLGELLLGRAGKPDGSIATREIRLSSGLVLGGVCLGLVGLATIALGQGYDDPRPLRALGGALAASGLLVLLWGILAGLPANRSLRVVGLGGAAIGAVGIVAFLTVYPQNWGRPGVPDHSVTVILTYATGLVLLVAATFGSLVADFVLRMQVKSRLRGELGREPTDEEIQRDIDEAMRRHKVTWGGLAEDHGKGIKVKVEALPAEWQAVMPRLGREVYASGERLTAVDTAVEALKDFRGGRMRTDVLPEHGLGASADALRALNTARATAPKRSWWQRLLHPRGSRWAPPPGYEPGEAPPPGGAPPGEAPPGAPPLGPRP